MANKTDWAHAIKTLIKTYKGEKHPLDKNIYQLLVMVVLSAQDSDKHINLFAPELFINSLKLLPFVDKPFNIFIGISILTSLNAVNSLLPAV